MGILTKAEIREICLANGFKTKPQPDGSDDLNPYVYTAVEKAVGLALTKIEHKAETEVSDVKTLPPIRPIQVMGRLRTDVLQKLGHRLVQALGDNVSEVPLTTVEQDWFGAMLSSVTANANGLLQPIEVAGYRFEQIVRSGCIVTEIRHVETGFVLFPSIDGTSWRFVNLALLKSPVNCT